MFRFALIVACAFSAASCFAQAPPPPPGQGPGIEGPALMQFTEVNAQPVVHHNDTVFFMVSGKFDSDFSNHRGIFLWAAGYPVIADEFVISQLSAGKFAFSASVMLQLPGSTTQDLQDSVNDMNSITPNLAVESVSPYAIIRASVTW